MKTYYFNNDSWYDVPACDCCDHEEIMNVFNIDLNQHPEFYQNGSAHSLEDCYEDVLIYEGVIDDDWRENEWEMDWEEEWLFLEGLMGKNDLQVRIEKLDSPDEYDVYP